MNRLEVDGPYFHDCPPAEDFMRQGDYRPGGIACLQLHDEKTHRQLRQCIATFGMWYWLTAGDFQYKLPTHQRLVHHVTGGKAECHPRIDGSGR
jgi:hypothetical protein